MNRLQSGVALKTPRPRQDTREPVTFDSRIPNHRFFIPLHYEKNYAYPLLVWLHGATGSELEISQVMPHISMRNYVGVSPRGAVKHAARHANGDATFTWDQRSKTIEFAFEDVLQCIDIAKRRFHIAHDRVFLVGNGPGGTMALRLALTAPQHFAGVATIGGAMPTTRQPLAGVQRARSLPVMIAHGRDSDVYGSNEACNDLRLLHAAGFPVTLFQYPCPQEVTTKMLSDLNGWMMERISGPNGSSASYDDPARLRIHDHN